MNFRVNRIILGLHSLEGRVLKSPCKRTSAMVGSIAANAEASYHINLRDFS